MYSYASQFFSGTLDPFWPHAILIAGCIIGGALVGLGVILEAENIFSAPVAAVFVGVVLEAAATLLLFGFDEGVTGKQIADLRAQQSVIRAQNDKIIELEKRLQPRTLSKERQQFVTALTERYKGQKYDVAISPSADDALLFWHSLYGALQAAGWVYLPPSGPPTMGDPPAGIPILSAPGVEILFNPGNEANMLAPALALGNAIHADGTVVAVNRDNKNNPAEASDVILIRIGVRVPPP